MEHNEIELPTEDLERFTDRYSLGRDRGEGSRNFLRVKVPGGILNSNQFRGLAELSETFGKGYAEITDRQDIQLHWISQVEALEIFTRLDRLGFTTDFCGQAFPAAGHGDPRNITGCAIAGVNIHELIDPTPLIRRVTEFFRGNRDFLDLPRKFKITVSSCDRNCNKPVANDLALVGVKRPDGETGFTLYVGGSLGLSQPGSTLAQPLRVFVKPEESFEVIKSMVEAFREYGNRESKPRARFKWLVWTLGVKKIRELLEKQLGRRLEDYEPTSPLKGPGEHIGVQKQRQEGYCYINVPIMNGVLSAEKIKRIAELSDTFGSGEIRLTPWQNLILVNIPQADTRAVLKGLEEIGLPLNVSPIRWTTVGCASNFCGPTQEPHAKTTAKMIIEHLEAKLGETLGASELTLGVSGCCNGCGEHLLSDIGLVGVKIRRDGEIKQAYDLYVGGSNSSLGKLVKSKLTVEEAESLIQRLVSKYVDSDFRSFKDFYASHSEKELSLLLEEG